MRKLILSTLFSSLALSACGQQTLMMPQQMMPPAQRFQNFAATPQYNPVPVTEVKRYAIDFTLERIPASLNAMTAIAYRTQSFVEQARLIKDGDIERFVMERVSGAERADQQVIRVTFLNVKNPELLQQQIFPNLVSFVSNEIKKAPPPAFLHVRSAQLVNISGRTPVPVQQIDL